MNQIDVTIPHSDQHYKILIEQGLLQQPKRWLPTNAKQCILITDEVVNHYHGHRLVHAFNQMGIQPLCLTFKAGESSKTHATKLTLESKMFEHACGRDSLILALGGGVVGDLAGFIAATYMRGIDIIHIPTSLLAMVDSSIGGKVGLDNAYGKNLIGAFHHPKAVISDIACLDTLPVQHRIYGLIEAVKMFITFDQKNFNWVDRQDIHTLLTDKQLLLYLITHAVSLKVNILMHDPQEKTGLRTVLNFGHTIGHALEKLYHYRLPHAEAVALGILVETQISRLMDILSADDCTLVESFLMRIGTDINRLNTIDINEVIAATTIDKKIKNGQVRYPLLQQIGQVYVHDNDYTHLVDNAIVKQAWNIVKGRKKYDR